MSEENIESPCKKIDLEIFEKYVKENMTEKCIKLIRRYYGIMAKK